MGAIYAPTVVINDLPIAVKPNSVSEKFGKGERKVRVGSAGGGSIKNFYSEDIESKKGYVKITLYSTSEHLALLKTWTDNQDRNTIQISHGSEYTNTYLQAVVTTETDKNHGVDGEFEVMFEALAAS